MRRYSFGFMLLIAVVPLFLIGGCTHRPNNQLIYTEAAINDRSAADADVRGFLSDAGTDDDAAADRDTGADRSADGFADAVDRSSPDGSGGRAASPVRSG